MSNVLRHDDTLIALFSVWRARRHFLWVLVTCAIPSKGGISKAVPRFAFFTQSRRQDPCLYGDELWLTHPRGIYRWRVGDSAPPVSYELPPNVPSGDIRSPLMVRDGSVHFFFSAAPLGGPFGREAIRRVALCSARPVDGRLVDVQLFSPHVLDEPDEDPGHVTHLVRWKDMLTGVGRKSLFGLSGDLRSFGRYAPDLMRHVEAWSLSDKGFVVAIDAQGFVTVVPVEILQHSRGAPLTSSSVFR